MEHYPLSTIHYPLLPIAFGILNLPMLGWLAAAAAPIVIHLLSRRKYREMSWAAVEYLLAAVKRQNRRLRFEQWLLLAIRTLLVVLLVLAVAEPYLQRAGFAGGGGGRVHRLIVVDASFSMAYKPAEKSRFDRAKQLARQIVQESRQGDAFTLVLMASPPKVVIGTPALEPGEVLDEIDHLQRTDTSADLPATVAKIRRIIEGARREHPGLARHEVYFLTDLQRVTWRPKLPRAAMAELRRGGVALAQAASVVVIDLGQPDAENLAVTDLRTLEPIATLAGEVLFEATLRNFTRQPRVDEPVQLLVDGRRVAETYAGLPPGGESLVGLSYRFETPGDHAVEVRIDGDALEVDNRRYLAVPVRQSLRVLCIEGRPSGEPYRGAADYLAVALSPLGDRFEQTPVQVDVAMESALLERDLGRYDCLLLCDVAQFTAGEARVLGAYLQNGGNVVFFLGEGVLAGRYNSELNGTPQAPRILPARLENSTPQGVYFINPLQYAHPMVRAFRGREEAGLSRVPIFKYFKLDVPKGSDAKVVLQTAGGDPLIVEERLGRGRVVLVATSADTSWSSFPLLPAFVSLVQEMLAFCAGGELQQRNVEVGRPLVTSVPAPSGDVSVLVHSPDGRSRPAQLRGEGDYAVLSFAETAGSGVYTVRLGRPIDENRRFAVNLDTAESDLAQVTPDELRSEVWPGVPLLHQTTWQDLDGRPAAGPIARSARLHVGLLYVVLGLLFTETYLAWRFGYHTS